MAVAMVGRCLALVTLVCLGGIQAHVRLTYPPARTFALDFLDNVRTQGPCGMESSGKPTMIVATLF